MSFLTDILSPIADVLGIIGFFLAILTYKNTQKIKSSDARISFREEKDTILSGFTEKLNIVKEYTNINNDIELTPCLQAMKDVLDSVNKLNQYCVWNAEAKRAFSAFSRHEAQVKQIDTLSKPYTEQNLTGITKVIKEFISHLEKTITIVEKQE